MSLIFILSCLPTASFAQATLHTLFTNGPVSNRLNVVVFSEAYNSSDLASYFLTDASNSLANLFLYQPYQEYRSYINAYAIAVASTNSGATHQGSVTNHTYFNSSYDLANYVITIPPNSLDTNYADGQGKVDALVASLMPQSGFNMLLVNDPQYGGSGGTISIVSSADTTTDPVPEITAHESGHTLGKLGDEYAYAYSDVPAATNSQPNTTQSNTLVGIKWNAWITNGTPIPTEEANQQFANTVGLFQGANYNSNGWYRPQLECIMRDLDDPNTGAPEPFCKICAEALVKAIYQKARPIDAFSPVTNTVTITSNAAVAFSITPLQPATHNLALQWFTNGVAVGGATNAAFNFAPQNFTNGAYTLAAQAHDPTPFVRNDPSNLLTATVNWTVNVSISQLFLDSARFQTNGNFSFRLTGSAPHGFVIQSSTNLNAWVSISTNSLSAGQFIYTNTGLAIPSRHFYRALILP